MYHDDRKAGHKQGAEYWKGAAAAAFVANPKHYSTMTRAEFESNLDVSKVGLPQARAFRNRVIKALGQTYFDYAGKLSLYDMVLMKQRNPSISGEMTIEEANKLRASGRVVVFLPRKKEFHVDGYQRFKLKPTKHNPPVDRGRLEWMERLKMWRVIWYRGRTEIKVGDYKTREEAWQVLRNMVEARHKNPRTDLYSAFHGVPPKGIRTVFYEPPKKGIPLIKVGRIYSISYEPESPSRHKNTLFEHKFGDDGYKVYEKDKPLLVTDKDGKNLYIVRDKDTKFPIFTSRGIIR